MSEAGLAQTDEPIRRPPKVVLGVSLFVLVLLPIFTMAGGGGIALIMTILSVLGLAGLAAHKAWKHPLPIWLFFLTAFLAWAWLTQFWSPYEKTSGWSNAERIFVSGLIFPTVIWLWAQMRDHPLGSILRKGVIFACLTGIALLFVDAVSNFFISFLVDPVAEGESFARRHADATRNVSRGIVFYSAMVFPVAALIWPLRFGRLITLALLGILSVSAWKLGVYVAVIAPWLGLGFGCLARKFPGATTKVLLGLAAIAILAAPLFGGLITLVNEDALSKLPASWEHRLYMWDFVFRRISESPLIGHGFDAARTYADMLTLSDGQNVTLLSLHTHNVGLQIWLETGLIGAALSGSAILSCLGLGQKFAMKSANRAFGLCGFLTVFILGSSFSFGVWQFWWWGTLFLGLAVLNLVRLSATSHTSKA
jgi:O-antigen ligase